MLKTTKLMTNRLNPKLISIITPNYNSHKYILETIQSIARQTYENWEWLIIDDGSSDESPGIIQKWCEQDSRIHFNKRQGANKGASVCRNIGIEKSSGDYIIFLDADDLMEPFCLEQRIVFMQQNPMLDFAVFKMGYFQNEIGDTPGFVNHFYENKTDYLSNFLSYNIPWAITCPIWRTDFLFKNNIRFSEKYQRLQDPEFHTKILLKYNPQCIAIANSSVDCYYRQSQHTKAAIKENSFRNITNGFLFFLRDVAGNLDNTNQVENYQKELQQFITNVFHTLLFQYRLSSSNNLLSFYKEVKKVGFNMPFSSLIIILFYYLNRLRLTFLKGAGISRIWKTATASKYN